MAVDRPLQFVQAAIDAAIEFDHRELHGDELVQIPLGD